MGSPTATRHQVQCFGAECCPPTVFRHSYRAVHAETDAFQATARPIAACPRVRKVSSSSRPRHNIKGRAIGPVVEDHWPCLRARESSDAGNAPNGGNDARDTGSIRGDRRCATGGLQGAVAAQQSAVALGRHRPHCRAVRRPGHAWSGPRTPRPRSPDQLRRRSRPFPGGHGRGRLGDHRRSLFPTRRSAYTSPRSSSPRTTFVTDEHRRRADAILLRRTDRFPLAAPSDWDDCAAEPGPLA